MSNINASYTSPDIAPPVKNPTVPKCRLPSGSCDSHAHIFGPSSLYPFASSRDYTPHDASLRDYAKLLEHLGFERAVLVQPSVYGTNNQLLVDALAGSCTEDFGIEWRGVAVLDDSVRDSELDRLNALGIRGVRLNLLYQGANVDFKQMTRIADRISPLGWHMQFLIDITSYGDLSMKLSRLPVDSVIDHIGHFPAGMGVRTPQFENLKGLMRDGKGWMKLSGPNRISATDSAPFTDVHRLVQDLVNSVPDRLVFGTDWPHVKLSGAMPNDGMLIDEFYRWIDNDETFAEQILVHNPSRLYSF